MKWLTGVENQQRHEATDTHTHTHIHTANIRKITKCNDAINSSASLLLDHQNYENRLLLLLLQYYAIRFRSLFKFIEQYFFRGRFFFLSWLAGQTEADTERGS